MAGVSEESGGLLGRLTGAHKLTEHFDETEPESEADRRKRKEAEADEDADRRRRQDS